MLSRLSLSKQWQAATLRIFACRGSVALSLLALLVPGFSAVMQAAQSIPSDQQLSGGLVTLRGNTRPEAKASNDRGRVADDFPMNHMVLLLRRSPEQEQALEQFINDLHDPASAVFHHWIRAEEFGRRYGVASADVSWVTDWLESQGFQVNLVYTNRILIDFTGSAGQVRQAFRTEIHHLMVKGEAHIANMSDPQIPVGLASMVRGIVSLNDFRAQPMLKARADYNAGGGYDLVAPADVATIYNFSPAFAAGYSGQGQTIVLLEDTDLYTTADWTTFRSTFGLASAYPSASLTQVHPSSSANNCTDPGVNGDDAEAALDVEWASAGAPSAQLEVASCAEGLFVALQNLLNATGTLPAIVSISYGESESYLGASYNAYVSAMYQQAVTEGVSVFVSSGDDGAEISGSANGINVSGFTSTPYNVSVGGTDFADTYEGTKATYWNSANTATYGSALSYVPEIPWNDSCASVLIGDYLGILPVYGSDGLCNRGEYLNTVAGSGGPSGCATGAADTPGAVSGTCAGYPKPSWQSGLVGNPNDGVRDVPDVSLFAANGVWDHYYVVCYSDPNYGGPSCSGAPNTWAGYGGTSVSTPIMAAMQALVNQASGTRWGNPNPTYYALARSEYGSSGNTACVSSLGGKVGATCVFNDVTQIPLLYTGAGTGDDNDVLCSGMNCYAPSGVYGVLSTAPQALTSAVVTYLGSGYTSAPTCALSGGGGSGATCSASTTGVVSSITLTNAGSGYTTDPVCTLAGGGGTGATCVAYLGANNEVSGVYLTSFGKGYTSVPTCTINRGYGGGATCSATVASGIAVNLSAPGSGYTSLPHCAISGGGGTGGTCAAGALNSSDADQPAFAAETGWDFATGIGTVNASNLVGSFTSSVPSFSSSSFTFPAQPLNTTSSAQTVTVTNTGQGNLVIVTAAISGADPSDFAKSADTCTGATVLPTHTCTVSVTFKPSTPGSRSASLVFTDIAPHSPQTVSLTGTGASGITVTLSPATASVALSGTQVFTATIKGTTNTALSWYVNGVLNGNATQGTLTACTTAAPLTCKYTAPPVNVPSPNPAVIKVVSVADSTQYQTANVTVTDTIEVTLSPTTASLALSGTQVFTATITGSTNTTLNWYVNGVLNGNAAQGTLTACTTVAPRTCTYTAPPVNVPSPNPAVISVASAADPAKYKRALVTVTDNIALTLSPASLLLPLGGTQVYTATISGTTNSALNWYVNGVLNGNAAQGTLTTCTTVAPLTCTYTAPPVNVPNPNHATIEVTSQADPLKHALAYVHVTDSIAVTLSPASASVALGGTQVFTATISGTTNTALNWYVNGVQNGNSTQGTLTGCTTAAPFTCTYTAPASAVPSPNPAVIEAASVADPSKYQTASVTVTSASQTGR
jgi:hypothetical protein